MSKPVYKIDTSVLTNRGAFDFAIVSEQDVDEVLAVLRESFFDLELVHHMLRAIDNPASIQELEQLVRKTLEDGVSVVAKDKASGKIVSVAACKIQEKPEEGKPGAFDAIAATFKEPESLGVIEFMIKVDGKVDMWSKYNTSTIFEIMFLGTLPEYCGRRIAKDVCTACLQVAAQTPAGAVNILASSPWTEKIAIGLGFELLHEADYAEFVTKHGVKYSDLVGKEKTYTLRALPLKPQTTKI